MKSANQTALLVLGGIGAAGLGVYYYFSKKLQPVGGIKGATDAASGVSSIVAGVTQLATPFKALWASFMTPSGAGSAPNPADPKSAGSPAFFPADTSGVPSWLGTTSTAVNAANAALPLIRDIYKLTR